MIGGFDAKSLKALVDENWLPYAPNVLKMLNAENGLPYVPNWLPMESAANWFDVTRPRKVAPEKMRVPSRDAQEEEIPETGGTGGGAGGARVTVKPAYQASKSVTLSRLGASYRMPKKEFPASRVSAAATKSCAKVFEWPVPTNTGLVF